MFVFLLTGILKLDQVKDAGKFLIEIMPVLFIPAGVGLMSSWNVLKPVLIIQRPCPRNCSSRNRNCQSYGD